MKRPALPPLRSAGIALALAVTAVFAGLGPPTGARAEAAFQAPAAVVPQAPDPWAPFRFFVGRWQGKGDGPGGPFTGRMEFQLVLGGHFLQIKADAKAEPSAKMPMGYSGEDTDYIGYDAAAKIYSLRQFRSDGTAGLFVCRKVLDEGKTFIFVSRPEEGASGAPRWKATYRITGPQDFSLTVETAAPDKDYEKVAAAVFKKTR
jgi:hypothetical protein